MGGQEPAGKSDARFISLTVSPSEYELIVFGLTTLLQLEQEGGQIFEPGYALRCAELQYRLRKRALSMGINTVNN